MLERRKDDYADVVRNRFFRMVYGEHPYGRVKEGTSESITAMRREDLTSYYEREYAPGGSILAIVGDIRAEEASKWVEERFGGWRRTRAGSQMRPSMPSEAPGIETIPHDHVTQAYIRMGNVGMSRLDPDHDPAILMNYILGGSGFGSRLMKNLREERGLTYGVHSNFLSRKEPGYFFATTQTGIETMNEAVREMLAEIRRFVEQGVTDEELGWAKKFFTGSLPLQLETNDQLAQKLLEQEFHGLPDNFWLLELERMQQVTREEVHAAARRQIHPDSFSIVVLADFREHPFDVVL
jgi:zinc protease